MAAVEALRVRVEAVDVDGAGAVDEVAALAGVVVRPARAHGQQRERGGRGRAHRGTAMPLDLYVFSSWAKYSARWMGDCEYSLSAGGQRGTKGGEGSTHRLAQR